METWAKNRKGFRTAHLFFPSNHRKINSCIVHPISSHTMHLKGDESCEKIFPSLIQNKGKKEKKNIPAVYHTHTGCSTLKLVDVN